MTSPLVLPSNGDEESTGVVPTTSAPATPCSPFDADGLCRHCRGLGEHTSGCVYAREWEKFGGGL